MRAPTTLLAFLGLLASVGAEMKMKSPKPIAKKGRDGPCGDMDPYDRTKVEEWPVRGHDVGLKFFENNTYVTLQATVIDEGSIEDFRELRPEIHVPKADDYCFMRIRGVKKWIGKDVLFQAKQYVPGRGYNFTVCFEANREREGRGGGTKREIRETDQTNPRTVCGRQVCERRPPQADLPRLPRRSRQDGRETNGPRADGGGRRTTTRDRGPRVGKQVWH